MYHFGRSPALGSLPVIGLFMQYANGLLGYFFMLTGFTLIVSMVRDPKLRGADLPKAIPTGKFLFFRLTRTYPMYFIALVLVLLLQVFFLSPTEAAGAPPIKPLWVAAHALMLQAWSLDIALIYNYPSWYLSADLFLCALFPLLYALLHKRSTAQIIGFAVLVQVVDLIVHIYAINHGMARDWGVYLPPFHLADFVFGLAGGFAMVRHYDWLKARHGQIKLITAGLALGLLALVVSRFSYLDWGHSAVFNPVYIALIISMSLADSSLSRFMSRRVLQYLGDVSYSFYIMQAPVSIVLIILFQRYTDVSYRYVGLLLIPVLLGVAILCHEQIEKPIKNWTKRLMKAPRPAPAPSL